jgi:predicted PurR-regulated permease PerM
MMRPEKHVVFWIAALVVLIAIVALLSNALLPFAVAAAIAYFLDPVADRLARLGLGRTLAAVLVVAIATMAIATAVFFLLPLAIGQIRQLALTLPADLERLRTWVEMAAAAYLGDKFPGFKAGLERSIGEFALGSSGFLASAAQSLWNRGLALVNLFSLVLVTPVVAFYLLRDWRKMTVRIDSWLPRENAPAIRVLLRDIDRAVGAFVRGQGTICLILGAFYAIALTVVGLRYGLVIGLATGLLSFVPMIGWVVGVTLAMIVALTQSWPATELPLLVLAIFFAAMAIDAAILSPTIVGQKVGLHPVALMLALFVFSALLGLLGAFVAVPVAAALAVVVRFARDRYLASPIYLGRTVGPPPAEDC